VPQTLNEWVKRATRSTTAYAKASRPARPSG
jgi:hypothetical protein